jgi:AcrR family transcriptional regulator
MLETGIRGFSVREVARRSGIPKSSIYRRWPTRAELLAAVLVRLEVPGSAPDTGSVRGDLVEDIRREIHGLQNSMHALPRVALEAREDPELAPVVRDVIASRRKARYPIFERGVDRGEISRDVDFDAAIDLLLGALFARLIAQRPINEEDADDIVDCALQGIATTSR